MGLVCSCCNLFNFPKTMAIAILQPQYVQGRVGMTPSNHQLHHLIQVCRLELLRLFCVVSFVVVTSGLGTVFLQLV